MSILKNLETYEKMLQNPKNRVSTSGKIKQPMPNAATIKSAAGGKVDTSNLPEESKRLEDVSEEEQSYLSAIDQRMMARRKGELPPLHAGASAGAGVSEQRIQKLEERLQEMQELLMEIMKAQMHIINNG